MRPLEILIFVFLAISALWSLIKPNSPVRTIRYIPLLALLFTIAHLILEGYRWQMIPLYALVLIAVIGSIPAIAGRERSIQKPRGWQTAGFIIFLVVLVLAVLLPTLLPVPRISAPSGSYTVGTRTYVITDTSRKELYSGRDEPRKFMIQIWYPAILGQADARAPWMADAKIFAPAISDFLHLPAFFLDHLALTRIPAYTNAQPAMSDHGYPVILFSHGWNGFAAQNSAQMVELASHGYVVAAIQHTYGALVTVFPDGEIAKNNPDALPESMPEPGYTDAARLLVNQWAVDISSALDFLTSEDGNASSPFFHLLDLTHVGVYGHSTGGGAAIQFCGTDDRCKAGLAEDAFMTPVSQQVLDQGLPQPFLFLFSQSWADDAESRNHRLFDEFRAHLPSQSSVVTILGTKHYDFTDLPLLSPLTPQLGIKGPINGQLVVKIIDDYLVAFFDQELKEIPSPIPFAQSEAYPDLRWEK
jgi:hypothetical protein